MSLAEVAARRLRTQRLAGEPFARARDAVGWLTAVQAQDWAGAKWAIGLRTEGATEADLDGLLDEGAILRTHVLRPTWHVVAPEDVRWLQELTAPRVKLALTHLDRRSGVDGELIARAEAAMAQALSEGRHLTRAELGDALGRAGIAARGWLLGLLVMHAELDGLLVSGARRGRQMTYALLEERAPRARRLDRDAALAELTRRYFTSHGPAQARDFAWWSGLTLADVRRGLELAGAALEAEVVEGRTHWQAPGVPTPAETPAPIVHLLPNYDEYVVAYRDRGAVLEPGRELAAAPFPLGSLLAHTLLVDGRVRGAWKRRLEGRRVVVELGPVDRLDARAAAALHAAAGRLAEFLGLPVVLSGLPGEAQG
jgi:hypothetical protein